MFPFLSTQPLDNTPASGFPPSCVPISPCDIPDRAAERRTTDSPSVPPRAAPLKTRPRRRTPRRSRRRTRTVPVVVPAPVRRSPLGSLDPVPSPSTRVNHSLR